MIRHALLLLLLFGSAAEAATGKWAGGISFGGWHPIRVELREGGGEVITGNATKSEPLRDLVVSGTSVRFGWDEEDGPIAFEGTLNGDTLSGTIVQNGKRGAFHLARVSRLDDGPFDDRYRGLYAIDEKDAVWIGRPSELRRRPGFVNTKTGRLGLLYPRSDTEYFGGNTAFIPSPAAIEVSFTSNGLKWRERGKRERFLPRLDVYTEEEVAFRNGGVTLGGTVIAPKTPGRHPAVVFLHGSGASSRAYFSSLPYLLARRGIAALIYDKRGVGKSTGDRHVSTFDDLADDAIAGIHLLQQRADIDPRRIGVWGHSQGGWTAPLAATRSRDVAFVVMAAGAATTVDEQIRLHMMFIMREQKFSEDEVRAAVAHLDLFFAVREGRAPWARLEQSVRDASQARWSAFAWKPKSEKDVLADRFDIYDPAPVLPRITVPLLALYGANDFKVHPRDNVTRLKALLANHPDHTIRIFENADHDFLYAARPTEDDFVHRSRYVAGYFDTILDWITRVILSPAEGEGSSPTRM